MPSRIHEKARTWFGTPGMSAREVPMAAEDFHGDGIGSKVAIVASDLLLRDTVDVPRMEHPTQAVFVATAQGLPLRARLCRFHAMRLGLGSSPHRIVSGLGQSQTVGRRCSRHADEHRFAPIALAHIGLSQTTENDLATDAILARNLLDGLAGSVRLHHVVGKDVQQFSGHVFNLETESGAYIANGIITHNCRCTTIPLVEGEPLAQDEYFGDWLGTQDEDYQREVLGDQRFELWKTNKLDTRDMVDQRGNPLTLKQLTAKYGESKAA